jgi:hypothetical protein
MSLLQENKQEMENMKEENRQMPKLLNNKSSIKNNDK